jgi:hypothetical protein
MRSRPSTSRAALVVGLTCLTGLTLAPQADARLDIKASGLTSQFRPKVHDYTLTCADRVDLSVRTPGRTEARIGGRRWFADDGKRSVRLAAGQAIRISKRTEHGRQARYFIRCLPPSFPQFSFERSGKPRAPFYVITPLQTDGQGRPTSPHNYAVIFDTWGVPIWWHETSVPPFDAKVLPDGTIASARWFGGGFAVNPDTAWELRRPDGKLLRTVRAVGQVTDFHDLQLTPDGNYLVLAYRPRSGVDTSAFNGDSDATVLDGVVQELTPDGELVSEWSTEGHVGLAETGRWWDGLREPYDIVHINAVEPLAGGDFMISLRNTDSVYRVDGPTGEVEWKLGGESTSKSLDVQGDPFGDNPLGGQHDIRSVGRRDVSIHDNGTNLRPPRAVRYRISGGVATLVSSVSDEEAPGSICCGSTRVIGGSFLTSWGGLPLITEADAEGRRTFRLHLGERFFSYRAVPIFGELTRKQLRAGMNRQVAPKK